MTILNDIIVDRIKVIKENVFNAALKANRNLDDIQIMAVTKTVEPKVVNIAIENGINLIGENRVQEYLKKLEHYDLSPKDIHFIGHLQTNKVKYIIDKVSMIESVSSFELAHEIDKRCNLTSKIMDVLLEVNIGDEPSKSGFNEKNLLNEIVRLSDFKNIKIRGLMCIPPKENVEFYFDKMENLFCQIKSQGINNVSMDLLSMGMSSDYEKAVLHNSNIIRLGNAIFGQRNIGG